MPEVPGDDVRSDFQDVSEVYVAAGIFRSYPAFRHKYEGQSGYLQAFRDLYGADGLIAKGLRGIGGDELINIYKNMDDMARGEFAEAMYEFLETELSAFASPEKSNVDAVWIISSGLASLKLSVEEGPGYPYHDDAQAMWEEQQAALRAQMTGRTPSPPKIQPHVLKW